MKKLLFVFFATMNSISIQPAPEALVEEESTIHEFARNYRTMWDLYKEIEKAQKSSNELIFDKRDLEYYICSWYLDIQRIKKDALLRKYGYDFCIKSIEDKLEHIAQENEILLPSNKKTAKILMEIIRTRNGIDNAVGHHAACHMKSPGIWRWFQKKPHCSYENEKKGIVTRYSNAQETYNKYCAELMNVQKETDNEDLQMKRKECEGLHTDLDKMMKMFGFDIKVSSHE